LHVVQELERGGLVSEQQDVALTVALAEYEHLRETRRSSNEQSTARFNFFLVVASGATAVAGGLITSAGPGAASTGAVAGIGGLVLLLGLTVFIRQVEFVSRSRLYGIAIDSVRTYLARRAPDVAPYLLLPTLDDPGAYQGQPPGGRWLRDTVGLAGTVGLVNSVLIGIGGGWVAHGARAATWLAVSVAVLLLAASAAGHVWYVNRRTSRAARRVRATVHERHAATGAPGPTA
jgi:hypothetical protein